MLFFETKQWLTSLPPNKKGGKTEKKPAEKFWKPRPPKFSFEKEIFSLDSKLELVGFGLSKVANSIRVVRSILKNSVWRETDSEFSS